MPLGRSLAVADVVKVVCVAVVGINRCNGVRKFAASVVAVVDNVVVRECAARLSTCDTASRGVVGIVVLRNDVGRESVADLKQLVVRVVCPGSD